MGVFFATSLLINKLMDYSSQLTLLILFWGVIQLTNAVKSLLLMNLNETTLITKHMHGYSLNRWQIYSDIHIKIVAMVLVVCMWFSAKCRICLDCKLLYSLLRAYKRLHVTCLINSNVFSSNSFNLAYEITRPMLCILRMLILNLPCYL